MTTIKRAWVSARGARWMVTAAVLVYGCNSDVNLSRNTGESHFLDYCDSACGDGLDCISGVCTRGCLIDENTCGELSPEARCTNRSVEPGQVAICDVECTDDADCEGIEAGHRCDGGYCRGGAPRTNGQGGEGGGSAGTGGSAPTGGTGPTGGAAPSGGTGGAPECVPGFVEYSYLPNTPHSCSACECEAPGADDCTEVDCEQGVPIYACGENDLEELEPAFTVYEVTPHFEGDVLELDVATGGGCEAHTLSLCFEPAFDEGDPVATRLHVRHRMDGERWCTAWMQETVRFDLTPLKRYYEAGYGSSTGIIATNYGAYGFGELSCGEVAAVARDRISTLVEGAEARCEEDADCEIVSQLTHCTVGTEVAVNGLVAEAVRAEIERIGEATCDRSCESPVGLPAPTIARCEEGLCRND